jgi:hypothetical protein
MSLEVTSHVHFSLRRPLRKINPSSRPRVTKFIFMLICIGEEFVGSSRNTQASGQNKSIFFRLLIDLLV